MSSLETAPAPAMVQLGHFIDGKLVSGSGRQADVFNPATGAVSLQVALADKEIVTAAIDAASAAFPAWRQTPPQKRAQILFRYKQLLEENAGAICTLITA